MFRRTPPRPLRPNVGNTVGLDTRFSGRCPVKLCRCRCSESHVPTEMESTESCEITRRVLRRFLLLCLLLLLPPSLILSHKSPKNFSFFSVLNGSRSRPRVVSLILVDPTTRGRFLEVRGMFNIDIHELVDRLSYPKGPKGPLARGIIFSPHLIDTY